MSSFADEEAATVVASSHSSANEKSIDKDAFTLQTRLWRRRVAEFDRLLAHDYRGSGTAEDPYIITWLPNDPENPQNFSNPYKWTITMLVAIATLAVALASSAYSGAVNSLAAEFGSSRIVLILGVSLFVLGFALGPLLWAPASEIYGRRNTFLYTYAFFTLWNGVTCASQNMASVLVFRFLAGAFGSSPLTNAGGTIADLFSAEMRGLSMAIFAAAPFLGPSIGPIVGGFLGQTAGWRWVEALLAIFAGAITIIGFFFLPETYPPRLLRLRASKLSKATGNVYRAPMDEKSELHVPTLIRTSLIRPWQLLFKEPIVFLLSIYMAIIYGTLYMLFAAYPIVYQQQRGWSPGIGALPFLSIAIGMIIGVAYIIFYENGRYIRIARATEGPVAPEARLPPAMIGGVLLVIGLAWFSATNDPQVHWIVPVLSGIPFGLGMLLTFIAVQNYLIDSYLLYAASCLAANSVLRSLFGAAFPLFTGDMYSALGIHWASAVPGFLALACVPFPFLFYKYGASIRQRCVYAREAAEMLAKMSAGSAPSKMPLKAEQPSRNE